MNGSLFLDERKINTNLLVRLPLGRPQECPGRNLLCPRDKPKFSPYFTQRKPSLSQGETQFVPGTMPGTQGGRKFKSGKSKGGLSEGGLGPKGANWAKKGPFGAISALPPWLWGAEELVPIGPEKAPIGPEKVPICPEKARFCRKDFPPIFSENLGLKPPFVSPFRFSPKKFMC